MSNGFLVQVAKCLLIIQNKVDKFYSFYFNASWFFFFTQIHFNEKKMVCCTVFYHLL